MHIFTHQSGSRNYRITLYPKQRVIVEAFQNGNLIQVKSFNIGDQVEYDSFNLSYHGPIVAIGNKTISVKTFSTRATKRMKPSDFAWRNWDFDLEKSKARNAEEMMYI